MVIDILSHQQLLDLEFKEIVSNSQVKIVHGEVDTFTENSIRVKDKDIKADVVICATGFDKSVFDLFGTGKHDFPYNSTIIPGLRNIALMGYFISFG